MANEALRYGILLFQRALCQNFDLRRPTVLIARSIPKVELGQPFCHRMIF